VLALQMTRQDVAPRAIVVGLFWTNIKKNFSNAINQIQQYSLTSKGDIE